LTYDTSFYSQTDLSIIKPSIMQKMMIAGRLGRDAQKKIYNGLEYVQFSVAVDDGYYDQQNQWVDRTNWYNCTIWRATKTERLKKGAFVFVEGKLNPIIYKAHDGSQRLDLRMSVDAYRILIKAAGDENAATSNQNTPPTATEQPISDQNELADGEIF
jgi:single stranded DNA-binding protein